MVFFYFFVIEIVIMGIFFSKHPAVVSPPVWGSWSDCKVSDGSKCGPGVKSRYCSGVGCTARSETQACSVPCPVNGEWTQWTVGPCDKPCGSGTQIKTRTCVGRANGGLDCVGSATETQTCNDIPCIPVNGGWTDWSNEECTNDCGGLPKTTTQTRSCTNPIPAYGGENCSGPSSRQVDCKPADCDSQCATVKNPPYPLECLNKWYRDAGCDNSSFITSLPAKNWFQTVSAAEVKKDFAFRASSQDPAKLKLCKLPRDGGWSGWDPATVDCVNECGKPTKFVTQMRSCSMPSPAYGGLDCVGDATQLAPCKPAECSLASCNTLTSPPYPQECLEAWYKEAGCTNLDWLRAQPKFNWWQTVSQKQVKDDFKFRASGADRVKYAQCII